MWRAFVMAVGVSLCILGGECMVVDRVVIANDRPDVGYTTTDELSAWGTGFGAPANRRVFVPPEWAPWGLLSAGALTVLYGSAMPKASG